MESLKSRMEWLQAIVQFVPIGIFQVDDDGNYFFVNPAWESITKCSLTQALGTCWWKVFHPDDQRKVRKSWEQAVKEGNELSVDCRVLTKKGEIRWIRLQTNFIFDDTGKGIIGSIDDITANKIAEAHQENLISELTKVTEQLEVSSRTDPLTSLLNRRGMEEKLGSEKDRMERSGNAFSLIMCDIDFFKKVNDNHGHDAGDHILIEITGTIQKHSRKQDIVCRWGGEEFLLMLPETGVKGAAALAEKLRKKVEASVHNFNDKKLIVTMSFGVACIEKGQSIDDCIKHADLRLYAAKDGGRNKVISCDK